MAERLSLLEFLGALHSDGELRAGFVADPGGTLADHGLGELSPADVHDAIVLVEDTQTADYTRDHLGGEAGLLPPPPPAPDDGDHVAAVEYLNDYLTRGADGAPEHQLGRGGDDFDQWFDADAPGPAGPPGDTATVAGAADQVVIGSEDTTAFGRGDATSLSVGGDPTVGDGSAFAAAGSAAIDAIGHARESGTEDVVDDTADDVLHGAPVDDGVVDLFDDSGNGPVGDVGP
jgi:hypothetical protein